MKSSLTIRMEYNEGDKPTIVITACNPHTFEGAAAMALIKRFQKHGVKVVSGGSLREVGAPSRAEESVVLGSN